MTESKEGWGIIRPGDCHAHYYIDDFSLCGRAGFYGGPLEPDSGVSRGDCKECRRKLKRRKEE